MEVEAGDPIAAPDGTWCLWTGGIPRLWGSSKGAILSAVSERVGSLDKAQALMGSGRKRWELLRERDPALVAALERKMAAAARQAPPIVADDEADEADEQDDEALDEQAEVAENQDDGADRAVDEQADGTEEQEEERVMNEQEDQRSVAIADHPAYRWTSGQTQFASSLGISLSTLRKRLVAGLVEERAGERPPDYKAGAVPNEYRIKPGATVDEVKTGGRMPRVKKEDPSEEAWGAEIASYRAQLDAACAEVSRQDALIAQMGEELEALRQERSIHWRAREEDTARLMERDGEREAVESERTAQVEDLKAQIGERDGVISDLRAQLAGAHLLLRGVASVKAVERERDHAVEAFQHAQREIEDLRAEMTALSSAPIPASAAAPSAEPLPPTMSGVVGVLKAWLGCEVRRVDVRLESGAVVGVTL